MRSGVIWSDLCSDVMFWLGLVWCGLAWLCQAAGHCSVVELISDFSGVWELRLGSTYRHHSGGMCCSNEAAMARVCSASTAG